MESSLTLYPAGSTHSELFSVSDLVKKTNTDNINEAINQHKEYLNNAIKHDYNTISEGRVEPTNTGGIRSRIKSRKRLFGTYK